MGAWGTGLQESDTAQEALDHFKRDVTRFGSGRGDPLELLTRVLRYFGGEEGAEAMLGVADALLERRKDLGDGSRTLLRLFLRDELRPDVLRNWQDPAHRIESLRQFHHRLHGGRAPLRSRNQRSWKASAAELAARISRQLWVAGGEARQALRSAIRRAEELSRPSSADERLHLLDFAVTMRDAGAVDDRLLDRFLRSAVAAGWKFPKGSASALLAEVDLPAARALRGG